MLEIEDATVTFVATITEAGLPDGTEWWANISGGSAESGLGSTAVFALSNGSYVCILATSDKSYSSPEILFTVQGISVGETAEFSPVRYDINSVESGLPSGTTWWVNSTNGTSYSSAANSISWSLSNGSCAYTVTAVRGWSSNVSQVSVTIDGLPQTVKLIFGASHSGSAGTKPSNGFAGELLWIGPAGGVGGTAVIGIVLLMRRRSQNRVRDSDAHESGSGSISGDRQS